MSSNLPLPDLTGRIALVTGGGRGIGRATARDLASGGAAVAVVSRTAEQLDEVVATVAAHGGHAVENGEGRSGMGALTSRWRTPILLGVVVAAGAAVAAALPASASAATQASPVVGHVYVDDNTGRVVRYRLSGALQSTTRRRRTTRHSTRQRATLKELPRLAAASIRHQRFVNQGELC
jgi:short chain dehydrogenase